MISPLKQNMLSDFYLGTGIVPTNPVATFGPVPPGFVWTFSVAAVIAENLTIGDTSTNPLGSDNHNELLANMVWTLYRNGAPEMTWIGMSVLCNVQAFGNDVIQVAGELPGGGVSSDILIDQPLPVTISMIGYEGLAAEVNLTVPFVSTSVQSAPTQNTAYPPSLLIEADAIVTNAGTTPLLASFFGDQVQIWSIELNLSLSATSIGARVDAVITDSVADNLARASLVAGGTATNPGNTSTAMAKDCRGFLIPAVGAPLDLVVTASGTGALYCSATVLYTLGLNAGGFD